MVNIGFAAQGRLGRFDVLREYHELTTQLYVLGLGRVEAIFEVRRHRQ